jgi:hypothetical protein
MMAEFEPEFIVRQFEAPPGGTFIYLHLPSLGFIRLQKPIGELQVEGRKVEGLHMRTKRKMILNFSLQKVVKGF